MGQEGNIFETCLSTTSFWNWLSFDQQFFPFRTLDTILWRSFFLVFLFSVYFLQIEVSIFINGTSSIFNANERVLISLTEIKNKIK